jgi:hypothetical protein
MKRPALILLTVLLFASCTKEDPLTLTGEWNLFMTFTNTSKTFSGPMNITQKSDNSLTGLWTISDNSGTSALTPISAIKGTSVTIGLIIGTTTAIYTGTVDASYNSITGNFTSSGVQMGTWTATRK